MRIKHSKYKNTGLIYELLVKQIAADTLSKRESPAVSILKKFFAGKTSLTREFKLYEFVLKNQNVTANKAETIVSTIIEISCLIFLFRLGKSLILRYFPSTLIFEKPLFL